MGKAKSHSVFNDIFIEDHSYPIICLDSENTSECRTCNVTPPELPPQKPCPAPPVPSEIPGDYVEDPDYVHTDNNFTDEDKEKLKGIEDGAEVNVQADWTETDTNSDSYIKNKPTNLVTDEELEEVVNGIESEISQKSTVSVSPTGTSTDEISYITIDGVEKKIAGLERPIGEGVLTLKKDSNDPGDTFSANATNDKTINLNLSTVASTGSYNDLLDKPADNIRNIKGDFVAGIMQIEVPFKSSKFGEYPLLRAYDNWQLELIGELSYIDYSDLEGNDRKAIIKLYSNGSQVNVQENGFYILG